MIKKLKLPLLFAVILASASIASATSWLVSVSYPSNPSASVWDTAYFYAGTTFTATMAGVGRGGGVSLAVDTATGQLLVVTNTGGGAGQPFYEANTSSPLAAATVVAINVHLAVDTAGAYGVSSLTTSW